MEETTLSLRILGMSHRIVWGNNSLVIATCRMVSGMERTRQHRLRQETQPNSQMEPNKKKNNKKQITFKQWESELPLVQTSQQISIQGGYTLHNASHLVDMVTSHYGFILGIFANSSLHWNFESTKIGQTNQSSSSPSSSSSVFCKFALELFPDNKVICVNK